MNVGIINSSPLEQDMLASCLKDYFTEKNIHLELSFFFSETDFTAPDDTLFGLVIMDLPQKNSAALQLAETLRKRQKSLILIFTSGSRAAAYEAMQLHAQGYLLKPFSSDDLNHLLDYYQAELRRAGGSITVKEKRTWISIRLDTILYTDYSNHYIQIHTDSGIIRTYFRFEDFAPLLTTYPQFIICYRNCIINMDRILSCNRTDFITDRGDHVPITRSRQLELHQIYTDYLFDQQC